MEPRTITIPGKIISSNKSQNGKVVDFVVEFNADSTCVTFDVNRITFHTYDWGQANSKRKLGFQMFNCWLRSLNKIDYLKLMKAAQVAGVSSFTDNIRRDTHGK